MLVNPSTHRHFSHDVWKLCLPFCSFEDACAVICLSKTFYTNLDHAEFWDAWFTFNIEAILNQFPLNIYFVGTTDATEIRCRLDGLQIKAEFCSRLDLLKGQWKEKSKYIGSFPLNIVYTVHWWVIVIPAEHACFQRFLYQVISLNASHPFFCTDTSSYKLTIPLPRHRHIKISLRFHSNSGLISQILHRDQSLHSWSIEFPAKHIYSLSTSLIISKNDLNYAKNQNQNHNCKGKIEGKEHLEELLRDLGFDEKIYFFPFLFFLLTYGHSVYADLSSDADFFFCESVLHFMSKWWQTWSKNLMVRYSL